MIEDVICPRLSRRSTFALAAVVLLGMEVAIACYAPPGWLRGFVGDVLVVALVYAAFGLCRPTTSTITDARLALAALLFAYAIEALQAFGLVDLLGLHHATPLHRVLRIALGATFDPWDLVAYTCGWGLCRAASRWHGRQARPSLITYPPVR